MRLRAKKNECKEARSRLKIGTIGAKERKITICKWTENLTEAENLFRATIVLSVSRPRCYSKSADCKQPVLISRAVRPDFRSILASEDFLARNVTVG